MAYAGWDNVDYSSLVGTTLYTFFTNFTVPGVTEVTSDYLNQEWELNLANELTPFASYSVESVSSAFYSSLTGASVNTALTERVTFELTNLSSGATQTFYVLGHNDEGVLIKAVSGTATWILKLDDSSPTLGTQSFSPTNAQTPFGLPHATDAHPDTVSDYSALLGQTFALVEGATNLTSPEQTNFDFTVGRVVTSASGLQSVTNVTSDGIVTLTDSGGATRNATIIGHDAKGIVVAMASPGLGGAATSWYLTTDTSGLARNTVISSLSLSGAVPTAVLACFAEGTLIATPDGNRAIETLVPSEMVLTASGKARAVKWIGTSFVRPARYRVPTEAHPVCIRAGAFAEGLPMRDLRVSPGHAIFVDGVLIPAGLLVNGATIVQEEVEQIRYFHVELDSHDVLLAEGLPCESYLDDGNRSSFANSGEHVALNGRLDPKSWDDACAPMVAAGPQLAAVQEMLGERAQALGWVKSEDADLRLVVDGAEIAPIMAGGNRFWFQAPAASSLRLVSNSGILAHVMPGLGNDGRRLGVAIADLRVNGVDVDLEAGVFGAGFHIIERFDAIAWRWTDGDAALDLVLDAPAMIEISLHMIAPAWTRPVSSLGLIAA